MEFQITFIEEQDAMRGEENFIQYGYRNVSRNDKRVQITSQDSDSPRWDNRPWYFDFKRPIKIDPILRVTTNGNYKEFLLSDSFADLELSVGNGNSLRAFFKVHRIILANGSKFFRQLLMGRFRETNLERISIDWNPEDFRVILDALYGRGIVINGVSGLIFLETVDYFDLVDIDVTKIISAMDIPPRENFIDYLTILRDRYSKNIPESVENTLGYYIDIYDDEIDDELDDEEHLNLLRDALQLLSPKIQNNVNRMLNR